MPADPKDQKHPPNAPDVKCLLYARRRGCDWEGRRGRRNDDRFVENDEGVRRKGQRLADSAVEKTRNKKKSQRLANSAVAEILQSERPSVCAIWSNKRENFSRNALLYPGPFLCIHVRVILIRDFPP